MSPEPWSDARDRLLNASLPYPIEWPNEPFEPPDEALWLSVEAEGDVFQAIELGNGAWEEKGTLYVHVMVPLGTGTVAAREVAKTITGLFRGTPGPVIYRRMSNGAGGPEEDGKWWMTTVAIEWTYTDRPS